MINEQKVASNQSNRSHLSSSARYLLLAFLAKLCAIVLAGLIVAVGVSTFDSWGPARSGLCLLGALVWIGGEVLAHRWELNWRFELPGVIRKGWPVEVLMVRIIAVATSIMMILVIISTTKESRSWLGALWPYSLLVRTLAILLLVYTIMALFKSQQIQFRYSAFSFVMGVAAIFVLFLIPESEFPSEWGGAQILTALPVALGVVGADWAARSIYSKNRL